MNVYTIPAKKCNTCLKGSCFLRGTIVTKALLRVQFLPALGGSGWEMGKAEASSSALLSKKGVGREGSRESQQKFDFFVLILCLIKYSRHINSEESN